MERELFTIASGRLTGALVGLLRPSLRLPFGAALALVGGATAQSSHRDGPPYPGRSRADGPGRPRSIR